MTENSDKFSILDGDFKEKMFYRRDSVILNVYISSWRTVLIFRLSKILL